MEGRILVVIGMALAAVALAGPGPADAEPVVTFEFGSLPDSYVISGTGEANAPDAEGEIEPLLAVLNADTIHITTFVGDEGGKSQDLGMPEVDYDRPEILEAQDELASAWPGVMSVAAADQAIFRLIEPKRLNGADGTFIVEARYAGPGEKAITIASWTPVRTVQVSLPAGPTHEAQELEIEGRQVIIIMPTADVVERRGVYLAYIAGERAVHLIEGDDFSEADDFVGLVSRIAMQGESSGSAAPEAVVTAELGTSPDSYIISGAGFTAGDLVNVVEIPCPDLPCPAEGLAATNGVAVRADGTFRALLQSNPDPAFDPLDGRDYRIIVLQEPGVLLAVDETVPFVKVPLHHPGVMPPATGSGLSPEPSSASPGLGVAAIIAVSLAALSFAIVRSRRA